MSHESVYRLPESLPADLEKLRDLIEAYGRGEISAAQLQAFRIPLGIYEQRASGRFMIRARLAAGILKPEQMRAAADAAENCGDGTLHFTSRQDLQLHGVALSKIYPAVVRLVEAGLSTQGGGGNTVRNISACYLAGVCPGEDFDVTPKVLDLTGSLLADPLSYQLPRKYKIACSGCGKDCAGATVCDLGFIAKRRDGIDGFAVYVGGGMGAQSRVGRLLEEYIPASRAYAVAESIKRVFHKHGNRKNRGRARIRFLIEDIGMEAFVKLYLGELEQFINTAPAAVRPAAPAPAGGPVTHETPSAGFDHWRQMSVIRQKQSGYCAVEISPPLGVLTAAKMRALADVVEGFGERTLRATSWQNAVLRWVRVEDLEAVHAKLTSCGLGTGDPAVLRHMVTCTGASTCRLGICLSRGLAQAIRTEFILSNLDLNGATGAVTIHISGCPNSCGRHPVGQIGLYGAARRVNGHMLPFYVVQLGGHVEEGRTVLASGAHAIPARNVPGFLVEFLRSFERSGQFPDFEAYVAADGRRAAEELSQCHLRVPDFDEAPEFYCDWGSKDIFSLDGRGPGECSSGGRS